MAIVTGGAQGIGRATVEELLGRGCRVCASDVQGDKVRASTAELDPGGEASMAIEVDVTSTEQVEEMVARTVERFGGLDILVNNAGGSGHIGIDHIEDVTDEVFERVVDGNLKSAFLCSRAAAPMMKERRYGRIVNLSSISAKGAFGARGPSAARLPYAGAKAGIIGLTNQLAKDLGPVGYHGECGDAGCDSDGARGTGGGAVQGVVRGGAGEDSRFYTAGEGGKGGGSGVGDRVPVLGGGELCVGGDDRGDGRGVGGSGVHGRGGCGITERWEGQGRRMGWLPRMESWTRKAQGYRRNDPTWERHT